jgi:Fe2+ transport system protein FeoA
MKKKLSDLTIGEIGIVKQIPKQMLSSVSGMGLRVNKPVKLASKQPMNGPVTLTVDNSSISIGRKLAEQIIIEVN